jgi:hypothetical protein
MLSVARSPANDPMTPNRKPYFAHVNMSTLDGRI